MQVACRKCCIIETRSEPYYCIPSMSAHRPPGERKCLLFSLVLCTAIFTLTPSLYILSTKWIDEPNASNILPPSWLGAWLESKYMAALP